MAALLPPAVLARPKRGFSAPLLHWLRPESVKPMERIEGIKIMHIDGLGGGGSGGNGNGSGGGGNFADGMVNSALRFRAQAPLVDQLLREIGLEGGDIQKLVGGVSGAQSALPPAVQPNPPASE